MQEKEIKNLKVFGYGLAVILVFISYKIFKAHGPMVWHWLLGAGFLVLVILTTFKLDSIKPFYKQWMRAAHFIGGIVTGLILSLLFYLVFGLVGIILRMIRKDMLNQTIEPQAKTYWIKREGSLFNKSNYLRQF